MSDRHSESNVAQLEARIARLDVQLDEQQSAYRKLSDELERYKAFVSGLELLIRECSHLVFQQSDNGFRIDLHHWNRPVEGFTTKDIIQSVKEAAVRYGQG